MRALRLAICWGACAALAACAGSKPKPEEAAESDLGAESAPAVARTAPGPAPAVAAAIQSPPSPAASPQIQGAFADAVRHARDGDYPRAASLFQSVLARAPRLSWAAYDLGVCYERLGEDAKAVDAYGKAIAIKPDLVQAGDNLTHAYLRTGKAAQAETVLRDLIVRYPAAEGLHGDLAAVLEAEGRYDDAATEAKRVLKGDERNVSAMLELASIYYHQKRFELSRMITENARQIDGTDALVFNTLAFLDLADKNQARALENFKKAAELREDLPEVQNNLGALLVASQDYPDAIQHLQLAVHYAPSFAAAHVNLGNAYRGSKQYQLALQEYQKALQLDPSLKDGYFDLGVLFLDGAVPGVAPLDRLNQSIAFFQKFRQAGGEDPKLDQYLQDAQKAIGQEKRHEDAEHRNQLRKSADAAKKAAAAKLKAAAPPPAQGASGSKLGESAPPVPSPPPKSGNLETPEGDKLGGGGK